MGLIKYLSAFGMIILFTLAVLGYMSGFADDNSTGVDIGSDTDLSGLQESGGSSLSTFATDINASSEPFTKSIAEVNEQELQTGSTWTKGYSLFGETKNILRSGYKKIFGSDNNFGIILTTILALMGIIMAAYIWKLVKGGNPD